MGKEQTQFKPGQSGNPGGRKKGVVKEARDLVGGDPARLLHVLLSVAENEQAKSSDRVAAVREYLDRGWGKAPSYAPVEGDPFGPEDVDLAITAIVDDLAARREAKSPRAATNGGLARPGPNGAAPSTG